MTYKTVIINYAPKTKEMAAAVEAEANKMAAQGYALVTMSITNSAKAILVFSTDAAPVEAPAEE
ncbi:MAG: hypothetical protein Q4F17_08515 [Eubacteriales bacterium]|nr:hypothetical protein [Eubacteriales bacterium]